jgi:predicted metalloprotease
MRLDDFRASGNVEDRRGGGGFGGGGGRLGIIGILVVLVISYFTGINPATLLGLYDTVSSGGGYVTQQQAPRGQQGAPGDASGRFVALVLGATEDTWNELFRQQLNGRAYAPPTLVLFSGRTSSACGMADAAMGPFYCPGDRRVYLDTQFFDELRSRFRACPATEGACAFSQAYVIAHEVGHHVQNLLGILPKVHEMRQAARSEAQSNALSVRLELQADCLAGVWAAHTERKLRFLQQGDVEAALQTASAIGDDMLQRRSRGQVVPDSFTHGSSAQRQQWFMTGLKSGQISSCNTFAQVVR